MNTEEVQFQEEDHDVSIYEQSKSMNTGETSRPKRKRPSKKVQMQEKDYDVSISEQEKRRPLQISCYPSHFFMKFEEIRPSLSTNTMNILYSSPFGHFFLMNEDIRMEKSIVDDVISTYSTSRSVFLLGDLETKLCSEEACLILGLPLVGNSINICKRKISSNLRSKYPVLHSRVTKQHIFSCIKEAVSNKDDEDAARLMIMFLFSTILFPAPNSSVPPALFEYVDDLSALWLFKWGDEVFNYLVGGIRHVMAFRKSRKSIGLLHGCSLLLLAMVYYRSENPRVFCSRGFIPRILNIDFKRTWKSLDKLSPFNEITIKAHSFEKWIICGSSRPTEWMDMVLKTMSIKQRKKLNVNLPMSSLVDCADRTFQLQDNTQLMEIRMEALEAELVKQKKYQDLNQEALFERMDSMVKESHMELVEKLNTFEQQHRDEMLQYQENQVCFVNMLKEYRQEQKDEMAEFERHRILIIEKLNASEQQHKRQMIDLQNTFEKNNASLIHKTDILFEKIMQRFHKLDSQMEGQWKVNTEEDPTEKVYRKEEHTSSVLDKEIRVVFTQAEDKCNSKDEELPFIEINSEYCGKNLLDTNAQEIIDIFLKQGIYGNKVLSTPSANLSDKDLHSIMYGRSLSDEAITIWFFLQKEECPICQWEGKSVYWDFLPANLTECFEAKNTDFLEMVCGKDLKKMSKSKLLFVPLKMSFEWHWHLLLVDYISQKLIFYDSSNPIKEQKERTPRDNAKVQCAKFLCSVLTMKKLFPNASKFKIIFHRELAQQPKDSVACGMYLCLYLYRLIRKESLEFDHNYAMEQRGFIAHKILDAARKSN